MVSPKFPEDKRGRKGWDEEELREMGALDVGPVNAPDLEGELHELFDISRWNCTPLEYSTLKPSMHLATHLLSVGLPFLAHLFPSGKTVVKSASRSGSPAYEVQPASPRTHIPLPPQPTEKFSSYAATRRELEKLAEAVEWQVNYEMYASLAWNGEPRAWAGITRLVLDAQPWAEVSAGEIAEADRKAREEGWECRPLVIGVMGEYVRAIRNSAPDSEVHVRAVFMAAVTMIHEIAHAVYHQDFRNGGTEEPYIGDDCSAEIGFSFVSWIFGGYHPQFETDGEKRPDFEQTLFWDCQYVVGMKTRPLFKTLYAIPVMWIEEKVGQEFWDEVLEGREEEKGLWFGKARRRLEADVAPGEETATARVPNFSWNEILGDVEWKDENRFRLKGFERGDEVKGLSEQEKSLERTRTRRGSGAYTAWKMSPKVGKFKETVQELQEGIVDEDEVVDEIGDDEFGDVDFEDPTPNLTDINDGVLETDVDPTFQGDSSLLTRIEVLYLSGTTVDSDNARAAIDDDLVQRKKLRLGHIQDTLDGGIPDYTDIDSFIKSTSPHAISSMSRIAAHKFCVARDIETYSFIQPFAVWQEGQLNIPEDYSDPGVAIRISNYLFGLAAKHPDFENDRDIIVKLTKARIHALRSWVGNTEKEYGLGDHPFNFQENTGTNYSEIIGDDWPRFTEQELNYFNNKSIEPEPYFPGNQAMLQHNYKRLLDFCLSRYLPTWGNRRVLVKRVERTLRNEARAEAGRKPLIRSTQPHRTDSNGFEQYVFRANPRYSSVTALKSALFLEANLDPEAAVTLFFYPNETDVLQDGKRLSVYRHRDWTTLRMSVGTKRRFGPRSLKTATIDLTLPRNSDFYHTKTQFSPSNPNPNPDPTNPPIAPYNALKPAKTHPTVGSLIQRIAARKHTLDTLLHTGKRRRRGLEIFDCVQDLQDAVLPVGLVASASSEFDVGRRVAEGWEYVRTHMDDIVQANIASGVAAKV